MAEKQTLEWFAQLTAKQIDVDGSELGEWIVDAESASVFPSAHPTRTSWAAARRRCQGHPHFAKHPNPERMAISEFMGILRSAERQLREGRLRAFAEEVRVETVGECIDVAAALLDKG